MQSKTAQPEPIRGQAIDRRAGFTLVEVICATFVGVMLMTMFVAGFTQQRRVYRKEQLITEMQQNARFAIETISRDIRMAGYGLNVPPHQLNAWVSWLPNFHQNPMITNGSDGNDSLTVVAAFNAPVATLSAGASSGSQSLSVTMLTPDAIVAGNLIFLGKSETLRVEEVSGNTLTVSAHPSAAQGISFTHAAGTPVELVSEVEYEVRTGEQWLDNFPYLARIDSTMDYQWFPGSSSLTSVNPIEAFMVSAAYIEDLSFERRDGGIEISLTARTSQPDATYEHPVEKDPFRRLNLSSLVRPRN